MQTAAAYIRVSTDDQIEFSPDSQIKAIREYAKRNDIILPEEYVFVDEGISGRNAEKRPAFMRMLSIAKTKPKPFDVILLWKFSRFARNREDSIVYKSMLRKECGIDVVSITEQLGEDKTSILIEALLEAMDEYYSINLAEEVKRGMTEKANRGEVVSIPPFGYTVENNVFVPNPDTAPVVQMIFNDFANGMGCRDIALKVNDMGILTKRGNGWENRTIDYLLNNPVYIGKLRWTPSGKTDRNFKNKDTIIVDGKHEPIINIDLWNDVHDKLAVKKSNYKRYSRQTAPTDFMLKGLVRCSNCGSTLVQGQKGSLQCHKYAKGSCKVSHSITFSKINPAIIEQISTDVALDKFELNLNIKTEYNDSDLNIKLLEKEKIKLKRIKQAYENGIDSIEEYKENKQVIMEKIAELEKKLNTQISADKKKIDFKKRLTKALAILKNNKISEAEKNAVLKTCVDKIVFNKASSTIDIYYFA